MKFIVVQVLLEDDNFLPSKTTLKVVRSSHPRYADDTRFDYGFMQIALAEGYTITVLPYGDCVEE